MPTNQTPRPGPRLETGTRTELRLTPRMALGINVLSMSRLELEQMIEVSLTENAALEDSTNDNGLTDEQETEAGRHDDNLASQDEAADGSGDDMVDLLTGDYLGPSLPRQIIETAEFPPIENSLSMRRSLADHLEEQLLDSEPKQRQRKIGRAIIGNLDGAGYLDATVEDILKQNGGEDDWSTEEILDTLQIVQRLDPIGIAARDVRECLLIQLGQRYPRESSTWPFVPGLIPARHALFIAECIVREHLAIFETKKLEQLAKRMDMPSDELLPSIRIIRTLNAYPAASFSEAAARIHRPDVTIENDGDSYIVRLNDDGMPRLQINQLVRALAQDKRNSKAAQKYARDNLKKAVWLMQAIDQRKNTIYKVATSIANAQRKFLDKGTEYLEPLTLKIVANEIEMAESTVSRVVNDKYVSTPQGIFELKYFFHSAIETVDGRLVSSIDVKERIKRFVHNENSTRPLSDAKISELLEGDGIKLARRTIAKYREQLKIPGSAQRRPLH